MSGVIYISYRREDASSLVGRLHERLLELFPGRVFKDLDRVAHGEDRVKAIEKAIEFSDVLIAVIGKRWLISDLGNLDDYVHLELAAAFKRNIRVVPLLVEGASMPRHDELPNDLKALATLGAWYISDANFDANYHSLVSGILEDGDHARQQIQFQEKQHIMFPPGQDAAGKCATLLACGDFPKGAVHRVVNLPGEPERSPVDCTIFASDRVEREQTGLLQAFLHAPEDKEEAESAAKQSDPEAAKRGYRSLVLDAPIGTTFAFDVEIEGFVFHERRDTLLWTGRPQAATFRFGVPKGCKLGQHAGTVRISQDGAPVGRITFQIEVVRDARYAVEWPVGKEARHYHACFCSYSSLDRAEMLKRAQGIRATGLETFIDVMSLRPGDVWNSKIFESIDHSDLFVVIWSKNARDSKWVAKESRYALRRYKEHGSPDFVPIPVEGPPVVSVPRGLQAYHFNDELLGLIRAAELEGRARKRKKSKR